MKAKLKNQKGIALIFALTLLGLLMFIGVGFVILSRNELVNSMASSEDAAATILADGAIGRVAALLYHEQLRGNNNELGNPMTVAKGKNISSLANPFCSYMTGLPSRQNGGEASGSHENHPRSGDFKAAGGQTSVGDDYFDDDLTTESGSKDYLCLKQFEDLGFFKDNESSPAPEWIYVTEPNPQDIIDDMSDRVTPTLVGRYAFLGFASAKIPSVIIDKERASFLKLDLDDIPRVGNSPAEFNQARKDVLSAMDVNDVDILSLNKGGGYLSDGSNGIYIWPDLAAMAAKVQKKEAFAVQTSDVVPFMTAYMFEQTTSDECFRMPGAPQAHRLPYVTNSKTNNQITPTYGVYHKFNVGMESKDWFEFWPSNGFSGRLAQFNNNTMLPRTSKTQMVTKNRSESFSGCSSATDLWWMREGNTVTDQNYNSSKKSRAGTVNLMYANPLYWPKLNTEYSEMYLTRKTIIPFICGAVSSDNAFRKFGFHNLKYLRMQLMGNIRDYCDDDNEGYYYGVVKRPVSTFALEGGRPIDMQSYENLPLINELRVVLQAKVTASGENKRMTLALNSCDVEVFRMYSDCFDDVVATISLGINVVWEDGTTSTMISPTIWYALTTNFSSGLKRGDYSLFGVTNCSNYSISRTSTNPSVQKIIVTRAAVALRQKDYFTAQNETNLNETRMVWDSGNANDPLEPVGLRTFNTRDVLNTNNAYYAFGFQADDPRFGVFQKMWTKRDKSALGSTVREDATYGDYGGKFTSSSSVGTMTKRNSNISLGKASSNVFGWDMDPEPGARDPWEVSTAFFRNGPMKSLWELGFIHRIAPWQTINLKKYNPDEYVLNFSNEGYKKGDARILDQVKIGYAQTTTGKISLAVSTEQALAGLLGGINFGSTPAKANYVSSPFTGTREESLYVTKRDPLCSGGRRLSSAAIEAMMESPINKRKIQSVDRAKTSDVSLGPLAEMLSDLSASTSIGAKTDASLEELAGKTAFVVDNNGGARECAVLIVAQTLKDNPVDGTLGVYDGKGVDAVGSTQRILVILTYTPHAPDPIGGQWRVSRKIYLDE